MQPSQARRAALLLALGMLLSSQGTGVAAQAASPAPPGDSSPSAASPSPPANAPPPSPSTSPPAESPPPPPSPPPTPQPASPEGSPPPASPQPPPPPDSPPVSPSPSPPSPASPSPGCDVTNTTAGDMCSLLQFKGALSQASELDNWDAASSDPCSWTGVSCYSGLTRVQNLTLSKLNLTGTLPTAWVAPMLLSSLALSGNSLSGTLPSSWTLPACCLGTLDLTINTLSGTLPAGAFSGLQALRQLLLGKNQLSGSLPALSVLAPGLTTLGLSNNRFNGSFPSGWALPASLTTLDISDNQLTGPFLAGWSLPASLAYCDISGNQLTGSLGLAVLPEGLGQLKMGSNNLTGAIPATFIPPNSQLTYLEMDNNHFAGALPDNLSMPLLQNAYFQSNSLTGELPANWEVPSEAKVRVLPQDTTGPCGSVPGTPEFYNAATNSQLTQGSLPACGSSPSPAPPPPVSPSPSSPSPAPPPAPAPPPSPSPSGGGSSSSTTTIIAAAAGGGAALAIIAALLLWWYVRRRRRRAGELAAAGTDSPLKKGGGSSEAHSVEEGLPYEEEEGPSDSQLGSHPGQPLNDVFLKLAVNAKLASLATTDSEGGASEPPSAPGSATVPSSSAPSLSPRPGGHLTGGNVMDPQLWTIPFEDLDMQRQIGEGSFGRVYLAKWQETLVAVKVLLGMAAAIAEDGENALLQQTAALTFSSPVLESLQKESALMCRLRHPNVVSFLGVCKAPPCVVTEYCSRGSLTDVLRAARQSPAAAARLDWARRLNMMLDTAKGMLHLHSTTPPIIHRDLKSPNLLVDAHWRVKISDFNLSKIMEESAVMSSVAATNPRWLAPEILSGHPASFASDVYAFGIVMWETATWDIPWAGENPWQLVTIVTEGGRLPVPPPAQLPGPDSDEFAGVAAAYLDLMRRCWAQQPETRPAFTEVITVLRELLEQAVKRGKRPVTAAPQHGEPPSGILTPTLVRRGGAGHNSLTDQQLPATPESSQTASDPRTITPLLGSL